jgi:hypothetical protein
MLLNLDFTMLRSSSWHRWLAGCGAMKSSDTLCLEVPEVENARLKQLAEVKFDQAMSIGRHHSTQRLDPPEITVLIGEPGVAP